VTTIKHIVFTSGGVGSWYAGKSVAESVGVENVLFLYTDTRSEDRDLYRFLVESVAAVTVGRTAAVEAALDCCRRLPELWEDGYVEAVAAVQAAAAIALPQLVWVADGRDLWQLFNDSNFIGNTRVDLCSRVLKRDCGRRWVEQTFAADDCVLYFGIDHSTGSRRPAFASGGCRTGPRRRCASRRSRRSARCSRRATGSASTRRDCTTRASRTTTAAASASRAATLSSSTC
jgi:hypothetical protein